MKKECKLQLVSKLESLTKRIRFKFLGKLDSCKKGTFGFKSNK